MKSLKENLPKDAHDTYVHRKLTMNWQKYFPRQKECPPSHLLGPLATHFSAIHLRSESGYVFPTYPADGPAEAFYVLVGSVPGNWWQGLNIHGHADTSHMTF